MGILLWVCRAFFGAPDHESTSEGLLWNMLTCKHLLLFYQNKQKINESSSSIACKNFEILSFESMFLKEKIKVLEEDKNKLEEELKCNNAYAGNLTL